MGLDASFDISPIKPADNSYDPAAPDSAWLYAHLSGWGLLAEWTTFFSDQYHSIGLADQAGEDVFCLGSAPAQPDDEDELADLIEDMLRHSCVDVSLRLQNFNPDHQLLIVCGFKSLGGASYDPSSAIQFFIGTEFVHSELINDHTETVALLVDVGDVEQLDVFMRYAVPEWGGKILFTGAQGYII